MLRLTRRTEYGLMALALLARRSHDAGYCCVREIVAELRIPRRLLAEILKDLAHGGLVEAMRGPCGGYRLRSAPSHVRLAEVVEVLEGPHLFSDCDNGGCCGLEPTCTIRTGIRGVAERIHGLLEAVTLEEIATGRLAPRRYLELELR